MYLTLVLGDEDSGRSTAQLPNACVPHLRAVNNQSLWGGVPYVPRLRAVHNQNGAGGCGAVNLILEVS